MEIKFHRQILGFFSLFLITGLTLLWARSPKLGIISGHFRQPHAASTAPVALRVISYNLQNLFDTHDDPATEDEEFLPLKMKRLLGFKAACGSKTHRTARCRRRNWTEKKYQEKLRRIAEVLNSAAIAPAQIIILSELENRKTLEELAETMGPNLWRTQAHLESSDPRGIDTAVLSTLPFLDRPRLHPVIGGNKRAYREIIEVKLEGPCKLPIAVFGFHFPSQLSPANGRQSSLEKLEELIEERQAQGYAVIAGGDSNVSTKEQENWNIKDRVKKLGGDLSHRLGCETCRGTYAFNGVWTFFDWIFVSRSFLMTPFQFLQTRTFQNHPLQLNEDGEPLGFTEPTRGGVSDHLPIVMEFALPKGCN